MALLSSLLTTKLGWTPFTLGGLSYARQYECKYELVLSSPAVVTDFLGRFISEDLRKQATIIPVWLHTRDVVGAQILLFLLRSPLLLDAETLRKVEAVLVSLGVEARVSPHFCRDFYYVNLLLSGRLALRASLLLLLKETENVTL